MLLAPIEERSGLLTVSELNAQIRSLLESRYPLVWVRGEISNFRVPSSGHFYFTLKDDQSQIRAVFFRAQHRHLRFIPESGLQVLCQARLSVYEPRGEYQLIIEIMEPEGVGSLQLAFEQLKRKLEAEGLFEPSRKLPLPCCPQKIGVITSSTGAAVQDILKVLERSPCPLSVTLLPVRVQGAEAAKEIAAAIKTANFLAERFQWDLLIVGRGGGSIEDLWPFNEEVVARAISASSIPIVSAVGHEIDFTIADMVSDLRAPTPTAAAEWVVGRVEVFQREIIGLKDRMLKTFAQRLTSYGQTVQYLEKRLIDPRRRLESLRLFVDERLERLQLALSRRLEKNRSLYTNILDKLYLAHPSKRIPPYRTLLDQQCKELILQHRKILDAKQAELSRLASSLESLSPLGVLARGYAIAYRLPDRQVIRRSRDVEPGQEVLIHLSEGQIECIVQKTERDSSE
jgi:exodeoxyribonuclease VII large subunit